jgi:hypothetical protein
MKDALLIVGAVMAVLALATPALAGEACVALNIIAHAPVSDGVPYYVPFGMTGHVLAIDTIGYYTVRWDQAYQRNSNPVNVRHDVVSRVPYTQVAAALECNPIIEGYGY